MNITVGQVVAKAFTQATSLEAKTRFLRLFKEAHTLNPYFVTPDLVNAVADIVHGAPIDDLVRIAEVEDVNSLSPTDLLRHEALEVYQSVTRGFFTRDNLSPENLDRLFVLSGQLGMREEADELEKTICSIIKSQIVHNDLSREQVIDGLIKHYYGPLSVSPVGNMKLNRAYESTTAHLFDFAPESAQKLGSYLTEIRARLKTWDRPTDFSRQVDDHLCALLNVSDYRSSKPDPAKAELAERTMDMIERTSGHVPHSASLLSNVVSANKNLALRAADYAERFVGRYPAWAKNNFVRRITREAIEQRPERFFERTEARAQIVGKEQMRTRLFSGLPDMAARAPHLAAQAIVYMSKQIEENFLWGDNVLLSPDKSGPSLWHHINKVEEIVFNAPNACGEVALRKVDTMVQIVSHARKNAVSAHALKMFNKTRAVLSFAQNVVRPTEPMANAPINQVNRCLKALNAAYSSMQS